MTALGIVAAFSVLSGPVCAQESSWPEALHEANLDFAVLQRRARQAAWLSAADPALAAELAEDIADLDLRHRALVVEQEEAEAAAWAARLAFDHARAQADDVDWVADQWSRTQEALARDFWDADAEAKQARAEVATLAAAAGAPGRTLERQLATLPDSETLAATVAWLSERPGTEDLAHGVQELALATRAREEASRAYQLAKDQAGPDAGGAHDTLVDALALQEATGRDLELVRSERSRVEAELDFARQVQERWRHWADPIQDEASALAARFDRLAFDVHAYGGPVSTEAWCQVHVHGGVARALTGGPQGEASLADAAAAWPGRGAASPPCAPLVSETATMPLAQVAWAQALFGASRAGEAALVLDPTHGQWVLDGAPVRLVGTGRVQVPAGEHRLELRQGDQVVAWDLFEARDGLTSTATPAGAGLRYAPWTTGVPAHDDLGPAVVAPELLPDEPLLDLGPDGPAARHWSIGLSAGGAWLHTQTFAAGGVVANVQPGWRNSLSFDLSLLMLHGPDEVFLSRWESTQTLGRIAAAMRWSPGLDWVLRPVLLTGAHLEPSVTWGPWAATGLTARFDRLAFDLLVSTPITLEPRLGHFGVETTLAVRLLQDWRPSGPGALPGTRDDRITRTPFRHRRNR